jgi:uncharacterized membrane protein
MSKVEAFLSKKEEQEVVDAIVFAEKNTSGEIRVHLEKETSKPIFDRAMEVFEQLEMYKTKARNGVLIYVAVKDKSFLICGDQGINDKVATDFWESTKNVMLENFKKGHNKQALVDGILSAGQQLKRHFPFENGDVDELSNEISKG